MHSISASQHAGLPNIRFHDLRHSAATLARGTHPKYVQHMLGHASINITLDKYSHWMPSMGRATAAAMDAALADDEPDNDAQEAR